MEKVVSSWTVTVSGEGMLKAMEELESAVARLFEEAGRQPSGKSQSEAVGPVYSEAIPSRSAGRIEGTNEEAAEFIRRALKRLRSL